MQHLETCLLIAEADSILCQLVMFLIPFFHWMYKFEYTCYQESSVIHGLFIGFLVEKCTTCQSLACIASVSVWFRSKERLVLAAREMKQEPKNERGGRGRGRKETLADKPLDFENLGSPANAAPDWRG